MENPKPNEDKIHYTMIFKDWQIHGLGGTNHENPLKSNCSQAFYINDEYPIDRG